MIGLINSTSHDHASVKVRDDLPAPHPASNEALVRVEASTVNRGELALLRARPVGWHPGQDVAGTVVERAADGTGPEVGTRIVGLVEAAGWSSLAAVPTDRMAELPDEISTAVAATFPIAGLTALRTLELPGSLLGRRVLVTAAAGGVGWMQAHLAVAGGAAVTAVTRREHLRQPLLDGGISHVVASSEDSDHSFDVVLDGIGGAHLATAITKTRPGGHIVLYGASDPGRASVSLLDFIGHENATLHTSFSYADSGHIGNQLTRLVRLVASGACSPLIGAQQAWSEANVLIDAIAAGGIDGKAVLTF